MTKWIRDGSIVAGGDDQIDIRCDDGGRNWITVKGPDCEAIVDRILKAQVKAIGEAEDAP